MLEIKENARGIIFKVFVQPRSSKNMIAGLHGDALKIKLKAPPVDGAANKMCIEYLAKCLNLPKSSLEILSGHASRTKRILVRFAGKNDASKTEAEQLSRSIAALTGT
ncbi:MAG: YggU family protein [Desulfobacterales bacterium]|nr:YggU family protein [Desulfobacterales bacterium]